MDRIREVRRASMVSSNGLSRRQQRISSLRDSPEEDGQKESQETVRLRDRAHKKDREGKGDRELLNRNKRRRYDKYVQGSNREEGEESTDVSVDNNDEDYYGEEDRHLPRMLPANHQSTSSSISNPNHRMNLAPARVVRSSGALRVADEMIGVPVPRKARTASVKRSQEYWDSGTGCYREVQNHRGATTSVASQCVAGISLSSSSFTARKKLRPIGSKTRLQKISSKPPSSSSQDQDDIEFEVAEALYDLMKQSKSQSFDKQDRTFENSTPKLNSKDANDLETKSVCSPIYSVQTAPQTSILPQDNSSTSTPLLGADEEGSASVSVQNCSITEIKADIEQPRNVETEISLPKMEKGPCEAMVVEHMESIKDDAFEKEEDPNHTTLESGGGNGAVTKEEVVPPKEESSSCVKLEVDYLVDSTVIKANSIMTKQEMKLELDLMTLPPMPSDTKIMPQDVEMKGETFAKVEEDEQTAKREVVLKQELIKLDSEKSTQDNVSTSSSNKLQHQSQKQQNQYKAPILEGQKFAQSSALPLPITVAGCPGSISSLGYMPPLQTDISIDGSPRSSTPLQPPHFLLSRPRPKRCATHHYIARNIYYHQQLTKINHTWPAAAGPESVFGAKQYNPNVMPSAQNMILGNPLQGGFPGEQVLATIPGLTGKDKSSEVAKISDTTHTNQLVLQQSPQPVPVANLLHGPAFIFPMSQHQAAVVATNSQSGTSKFAPSISNASLPNNSARGAPVPSSSFPAAAAAVSFNYPNLPASEAPSYMAILQNNGYPFPISTHIGMPSPVKGGTHPPVMPLFNGSFYSSPIFHPTQSQQQQPHSQPLMQSAFQNTSTSSGSSSSHKQSQSQQQKGTKVSSNSFLTSTNMQLQKQHIPPLHSSRKLEAENFAVPLQPMNFALMPPVTMGCGGGNNHVEQQYQESKGGMELIHPRAFALTFPSANSATSALNFSSMTQNPAFFQMLPDMGRHGYQIGPATQVTQQKNFQLSETKTGADSTNTGDGRKGMLGQSSTGAGQSLAFSKPGCPDPSESRIMGTVFDGSARTFSFISSSGTGNQHSQSTSGAIRTASVSVNPPNSQQHQQLIQRQKQHMMQQQMHLQLAETDSVKPQISSSELSSTIAAKFPNNTPVCSHAVIQTNSSAQSPHWRNSATAPVSQAPLPSLTALTTSKYLPPQQQMTQTSFGGSPNSARSPQAQQFAISASRLVAGSLPNSSITKSLGGSLKSASTGNRGNPSISAVPSQQTENSSNGPAKKSSPVCGRNVPSILSKCPSQLSELKY